MQIIKKTVLKYSVTFLAVAIIAAGALILYKSKADLNKTLVTVGDKGITQKDLNVRIYGLDFEGSANNPKKVSDDLKKQLLDELIEKEIYRNAAKRLGITVSEEEVKEMIKKESEGYEFRDDEQKNMIKNNIELRLLKPKVEDKVISKREGEYVKVRFDKYHADNHDGTEEQTKKQKEYAEKLANDLYGKLETGSLNFAKATEIVENDPTIDIKGFPGLLGKQGGFFGHKSSIDYNAQFKEKVMEMKVGELSKPFIVKASSAMGEKNKLFEIAFVLVKATKIQKGEADTVSAWLKKQKELLNVKNGSNL